MNSIEYTQRALARMTERGVSRGQVQAVLSALLRTLAAGSDRYELQS